MKKMNLHNLEKLQLTLNEMGKVKGGEVIKCQNCDKSVCREPNGGVSAKLFPILEPFK